MDTIALGFYNVLLPLVVILVLKLSQIWPECHTCIFFFFFLISIFSCITRCFDLTLYPPCHCPGISHFSESPKTFLVGNCIGDQNMSTRCTYYTHAHAYTHYYVYAYYMHMHVPILEVLRIPIPPIPVHHYRVLPCPHTFHISVSLLL